MKTSLTWRQRADIAEAARDRYWRHCNHLETQLAATTRERNEARAALVIAKEALLSYEDHFSGGPQPRGIAKQRDEALAAIERCLPK